VKIKNRGGKEWTLVQKKFLWEDIGEWRSFDNWIIMMIINILVQIITFYL